MKAWLTCSVACARTAATHMTITYSFLNDWLNLILTNDLQNAFPERRGPNLLNKPKNNSCHKFWASSSLFGLRSCVVLILPYLARRVWFWPKFEHVLSTKSPSPIFVYRDVVVYVSTEAQCGYSWVPQSWCCMLISYRCHSREILNCTFSRCSVMLMLIQTLPR